MTTTVSTSSTLGIDSSKIIGTVRDGTGELATGGDLGIVAAATALVEACWSPRE